MYDNHSYPIGADTPEAPWNQSDPKEMNFNVICSQSLSKTVTVTTNNYIPGDIGVDYEPDGVGGVMSIPWQDDPDTSDTNWAEEYQDSGNHTPIQLLELFKQFLEENIKHGLIFKSPKFTENLIRECEGWSEDETEFMEV